MKSDFYWFDVKFVGDFEYKPYVIAIPDVREISLNGGEDFIILACDGLWDYLSEDDAAIIVYNMVRENPGKNFYQYNFCH